MTVPIDKWVVMPVSDSADYLDGPEITYADPADESKSGVNGEEGEAAVRDANGENEVRAKVCEDDEDCPAMMPHGVIDAEGTLVACHSTVEQARAHADSLSTVTRDDDDDTEDEAEEDETGDESRDGAAGATDDGDEKPEDDKENAAPEPGSTPLIGPLGMRESWRL